MESKEWWHINPGDKVNISCRFSLQPHPGENVIFQRIMRTPVVIARMYNLNQPASYPHRLLAARKDVVVILINRAFDNANWYFNIAGSPERNDQGDRIWRAWASGMKAKRGELLPKLDKLVPVVLRNVRDLRFQFQAPILSVDQMKNVILEAGIEHVEGGELGHEKIDFSCRGDVEARRRARCLLNLLSPRAPYVRLQLAEEREENI